MFLTEHFTKNVHDSHDRQSKRKVLLVLQYRRSFPLTCSFHGSEYLLFQTTRAREHDRKTTLRHSTDSVTYTDVLLTTSESASRDR